MVRPRVSNDCHCDNESKGSLPKYEGPADMPQEGVTGTHYVT